MKKLFESTEERKRKSKRSNRYNKYNDIPFYNTKNIPIRPKDYKEPDYTMDGSVKQLFLNLTKMQITFGKEKTLKEFFPDGMQEDEHGNFFIKIGNSKTMFCGHLDTYSREYKRVYHVIQDDIIMTDGTTTLGGDDKAGIVIMIKMIESGIPGLYYFFRGEEGVTSPTGTWGSKQALKSYKDIFKTYEKCIAFDRKGFSSIISQQSYSKCCSDDFVDALSNEFKKHGLEYEDDKTGMWCDSGVFMGIIPECTNLSVGYQNEHTFKETQDIEHLEKLVDVCIKIDWEKLPVKRDPSKVSKSYGRYNYDYDYEWDIEEETYKRIIKNRNKNYSKYIDKYDDYDIIYGDNKKLSNDEIFKQLLKILKSLNYMCLNPESFEESESIYFQSVKDDDLFALKIVDGDIYMTEDKELRNFTNYGDFDTFKKYIISNDNTNTDSIITEEERLQTYEKIINMYPYLIWDIISDFENKKNNIISSDNWLKLDRIMNDDLKLKMEYASEDGYNPDDFSDWVKDNSDIITTVLKKKIKNFNPKKESFLDKINISDYYTDRQDEVFSDIVEKEKKLVQLIILDFSIMKKAKARQTTLEHINDTLIKLGYKNEIREGQKNINANEFVLWVYDNMEDIKDFYKI
ncbi:hypothetical protein [Trichloromonas sp.]|uniref:hypothetical protein n=1 Tax=Trichloromonas sp. TaxID=3069249 RepID=UPI002A48F35E|nr:hypothetical protein [Trichloromonas sp.]